VKAKLIYHSYHTLHLNPLRRACGRWNRGSPRDYTRSPCSLREPYSPLSVFTASFKQRDENIPAHITSLIPQFTNRYTPIPTNVDASTAVPATLALNPPSVPLLLAMIWLRSANWRFPENQM